MYAATRCKMRLFVSGLRVAGTLAEEVKSVVDLLKTSVPAHVAKASTMQEQVKLAPTKTPLSTPVRKEGPALTNLVIRRLRKGDHVRHSDYRVGVVLTDGKPKILVSQNAVCQSVDVQFETILKNDLASELQV